MSFVGWNQTGLEDLANSFKEIFGEIPVSETAGEAVDTPGWIEEWVEQYEPVDIYSPYYNPQAGKMEYPKKKGDQIVLLLIVAFLAIHFLGGLH